MEFEVTHIDGSKGRISESEAHRIKDAIHRMTGLGHREHMDAEKCIHKVEGNIQRLIEWDHAPNTEEQMKYLLKKYLGMSRDQADLLFEIIEWQYYYAGTKTQK